MRAVAFDLNGTLSDDEPVLAGIYGDLFAEQGRPLSEADYYERFAGQTDEEMFRSWLGVADPGLIEERIARYIARVADGSTVDSETRAAVRFAAARVPVAIVSASVRREIDAVLNAACLRHEVSAIVSHDDVTNGKPDPEGYLAAARLLGVEPEQMLVFEDTEVGLTAARAAGARVVGLTRTLGPGRMSQADELVERIDVALLERLLCS
jgi:sugar-phosphatase